MMLKGEKVVHTFLLWVGLLDSCFFGLSPLSDLTPTERRSNGFAHEATHHVIWQSVIKIIIIINNNNKNKNAMKYLEIQSPHQTPFNLQNKTIFGLLQLCQN